MATPAISDGLTPDFFTHSAKVSTTASNQISGHCSAQDGLGVITPYSLKPSLINSPFSLTRTDFVPCVPISVPNKYISTPP